MIKSAPLQKLILLFLSFVFLAGQALSASGNFTLTDPDTTSLKAPGCNPLPVPTITGEQNPCAGPITFVYTTESGMTNYSWGVSANGSISGGSGTNSISVTWTTAGPGNISVNYFNSSGCTGVTPTVYNIEVQATPVMSITVSASANPVCAGTPVTFTAVAVNGGSSPGYDWKVNGIIISSGTTTYTYTPVNGDIVICQLTSSIPCISGIIVNSNLITMAVTPNSLVSVNISPSSNPVCQGLPVTFTAVPGNGGTTPSYQWKVNGVNSGPNNSVYTFLPQNNDIVNCILQSSLGCTTGNPATSGSVTVSVSSSLIVGVSISASANPACSGTPVTFTSVPVNGGISPVYHWKVNGILAGTNSPVFSYQPQQNDIVTCEMTSSITCSSSGNTAVSNPVTMSVNPASPVSVTIVSSQNTVCQGSAITLTATCINGGVAPIFLWNVNGFFDGEGNIYTYVPSDNDVISCYVTSDLTCVTVNPAVSNEITIHVLPVVTSSIQISASSNPVCAGSQVTYTATTINGGTNPQFIWRKNGTIVGTNNPVYTLTPSNNDVITCQLIPDFTCYFPVSVNSNSILMSVSPLNPVSITIETGPVAVCLGEPVTFTAIPVNGGFTPVYKWTVNGIDQGVNNSIFTYTPSLNDLVQCTLTSTMNCVTGNPATSNIMTPNISQNLPVSVEIQAESNQVCEGQNITFTATPHNGGTAPLYHWIVNNVNLVQGGPVFTYQPANNDIVKCQLTSDLFCASGNPAISNQVPVTVVAILPVSASITCSANPVCQGSTVSFNVTTVNGGTMPVYEWMVNGNLVGTNSPAYSFVPVNGDLIFCKITSNAFCPSDTTVSSNSIVMNVFSDLPSSISLDVSRNPSCDGNPVTFTATVFNGGNNPGYQWKVNGIDVGTNTSLFTYVPLDGDQVTCLLTSSNTCSSVTTVLSDPIEMSIVPRFVMSVSIVASANPVCVGTYVTFTATAIYIGGLSYQWKINGVNAGTDSPTLTYIPINGDRVVCWINTSATCVAGTGIEYSNQIVMVINSQLPVSVSIAASENPVCVNLPVTFQATPVNGGAVPFFQWKVNGLNAGTNSSTFTYIPSNTDVISCKLVSGMDCTTPDTATSNLVCMNVIPEKLVSVEVTSTMNPACPATLVGFTATPVNGGTSPAFEWRVNGILTGSNSPNFNYLPATNDVVTCRMTSNMSCITGNPANSTPIIMQVVSGFPVGLTISVSLNPFCEGTPVVFTASPVNGGSSPVFQWMVNGIHVGTNNSSYSYIPLQGDIVTCSLTSSWSCAIGNPAISNAILMTYIVIPNSSVTVVPSQNSVCTGTNVSFTAIPVMGGTSPRYQWFINNDSTGTNSPTYEYIPEDDDQIRCTMKSSIGCLAFPPVNSNEVVMSVSQIAEVSVTISPNMNEICQQSPVLFTAVPINGGTNPFYAWKVNGIPQGANMSTFTYVPFNKDTVICTVTSNEGCSPPPVESNPVIMTVYPEIPDAVTVLPNENPACTGSMVTFTATPTNLYSGSVFEWHVNGTVAGTNQATFSYIPVNGDIVRCSFYSYGTCFSGTPTNSGDIVMMVDDQIPVAVTISTTSSRVCDGSRVTFQSHVVNASSSLSYEWLINGLPAGSDSSSLSYTPANGDQVTCKVTHTLSCALINPVVSNTIIMTVDPMVQAGISIATSENPVCSGNPIQLTATPVNGGSSPVYQWVVNNVNVGANNPAYSYIPTNGNAITCRITSNASCLTSSVATSAPINITVDPWLQVFVSISASTNPVCEGREVVFSANPVNEGSLPVFQWKVNGSNVGTNSPALHYTPNNNDIITCQLTSNIGCPAGNPFTSNAIAMNVTASLPATVTVTPSANPACQGTNVTYTAVAGNGGNLPTYQWSVNNVHVGSNNPVYCYRPINNDVVKCLMTSNALCSSNNPATSSPVMMNVTASSAVSVSVTPSSNPACQGNLVTFTSAPVNGGNNPNYQWRVNAINVGANQPAYSYYPSQGDIVSCYLTSNLSCTTGNPAVSAPVSVTIHNSVSPSIMITSSSNPVCLGTNVTISAFVASQGTTPVYQWTVNNVNIGTNSLSYTYLPSDNDVVTCSMLSSENCAAPNPAHSNTIIMKVSPIRMAGVTISGTSNPACLGTPVTFTALPVNGGTSPAFLWKINGATAGSTGNTLSYQPANGDRISCQMTSNMMCTAGNPASSNEIQMSVSSSLPVALDITPSSNPSCLGLPVVITANPTNGGSDPIYEWRRNGFIVGQNLPEFTFTPSNQDIITCSLTSSNTCAFGNPATSTQITMTVVSMMTPEVSITSTSNPVCPGTLVSYTALASYGGSVPVYQWYLNNNPVGTNSPTYEFIPVQGDLISSKLTSNETCAVGNPATSNAISMVVSGILPVSVSISTSSNNICQGTSVSYTSLAVNGGPSPAYQWKVNGTDVGTSNPTFSYSPADNDVVSCKLMSSLICASQNPATSNSLTMHVAPVVPVSVSISSSVPSSCQNTPVVFTAYQANGGITPLYQWESNGVPVGTNNQQYTSTPLNGDVIRCVFRSSELCASNNPATSNLITAVVFPVPSMSLSGCYDPVTMINAHPFKLKGGLPLGGTYSGPGVDPATGIFYPNIAGTGIKTITYSYTNSGQCSAAASRSITVAVDPAFVCGGMLTDVRETANPNSYPTVQIGNQCWMAANLNYGSYLQSSGQQTDNCQVEKFCYNDNQNNCTQFGGLYQWDELLQYQETPGVQGICPPGWHIPSEAEWGELFSFYGGKEYAGEYLLAAYGHPGFVAKPAGVFYSHQTWSLSDLATFFWTSTRTDPFKALSHGMTIKDKSVSLYSSVRGNAFSVRCVKD